MVPAIAMSEAPSEFWLECSRCNTYVNTYKPQPHQMAVHSDNHLYIGNFGAYGTGKTLTSRQEVYKHAFITPNANILIAANISAQYEQTIKREIENDLPKAFIRSVSVQKSYIDLINGARILFRPLDDPDKLRSLNLTMFVIIEASEVDADAFQQLKTRTRNLAASTPKRDSKGNILYHELNNGVKVPIIANEWRRGIIESNPDSGWIRTDVLLTSDHVQKHGTVLDEVKILESARDKAIATHIASTDANAYLPPGFVQELCRNNPNWWVNRYVFGSFNYAEGLVYPNAANCFVEDFEIPREWKRIVAADYGLSDDFVYLMAAIDEKDGIVYVYKEVRTNNRNIDDLAKLYYDSTDDIPSGGLYCTPLLDPKSGAKRDYNKKTLYDHFLDHGIAFMPGHVNLDARIYRTNTYLESGKLKIFASCAGLYGEITNYKFPPMKLGQIFKGADKPEDKNNHAINPLEWICMALPNDPRKIQYGIYDNKGVDLTKPMQPLVESMVPWQLSDSESSYSPYERGEWY